jgi:hypothetical protein
VLRHLTTAPRRQHIARPRQCTARRAHSLAVTTGVLLPRPRRQLTARQARSTLPQALQAIRLTRRPLPSTPLPLQALRRTRLRLRNGRPQARRILLRLPSSREIWMCSRVEVRQSCKLGLLACFVRKWYLHRGWLTLDEVCPVSYGPVPYGSTDGIRRSFD